MIQQNTGIHRKSRQEVLVIIGNGMVGHRLCMEMLHRDHARRYRLVTFCEESRPAYDRVHLTDYFAGKSADDLQLATREWYAQQDIQLYTGDRAVAIDPKHRTVFSAGGRRIAYDKVVLATGSSPFAPPVPGINKDGVFFYRTLEDLDRIRAYRRRCAKVAVLGGGLLGLEAAKAVYDLGVETHVVEFAPRLMPRQIDAAGSRMLVRRVEALGIRVHVNKATTEIYGRDRVQGMRFQDGGSLAVDMIVVSAGIRPRDELARKSGIAVGERGGVIINDKLQTNIQDIYAIGEVALYKDAIYGLAAPGYQMAAVLAANLCGGQQSFEGADMSTKLKLLGVDVANFGDPFAEGRDVRTVVLEDGVKGVYKKLVISADGTRLMGGILVGDASEYGTLLSLARSENALPEEPEGLLLPSGARGAAAAVGVRSLSDDTPICSCNLVTKGALRAAIQEQNVTSVDALRHCTGAGSGCGGCLPMVTAVFRAEMEARGHEVRNVLCEHFQYTRRELLEIVKINRIKTFEELIHRYGRGDGCEICKPVVASIFASTWHEMIQDHQMLQDTNDRFLANIQKRGVYSVIPRIPAGEITPEKLITLGQIAAKYGLYTKITGAQRVDLFGASVDQLPEIWEELVAAGFESGHAYGKAVRTVKSCVGSTWCRYGVQDSVGLAIRVENRYKGIRAPHKLKAAVSGCVRECAEAQSKDFGLIATEKGWNLFVCGNGGAKPRHADLLATELDEATALRYIDRFLMYYIHTADKLTRTSVWLDQLPGGIAYLKQVVLEDKLGICRQLEDDMEALVSTYRCEWSEVVHNPERRRWFRQFVNSAVADETVQFVSERGQKRPLDWGEGPAWRPQSRRPSAPTEGPKTWVAVGAIDDFPMDGGMAVRHGALQIAVFRFHARNTWYAVQNMCPHRKEMVLSRGILGDRHDIPKVACPMHKKTFSLETGECLAGGEDQIATFPVKVENGRVYLQLPASTRRHHDGGVSEAPTVMHV